MQIIEKQVQIKNILKWACSYSLKIGNKTFLAKSSLRWHARTQPPLMAILEYLCTGQEIRHHSFSPKRVNDDCCQMSLGQKKKKSTMSSKRSLSLLVALCQIITEPGLLQQLNSNSGTNHHGTNSPWREAQKALRITRTGLCCIPVCQAWVPLEEWQATPFFFFLLNLLFCSGV